MENQQPSQILFVPPAAQAPSELRHMLADKKEELEKQNVFQMLDTALRAGVLGAAGLFGSAAIGIGAVASRYADYVYDNASRIAAEIRSRMPPNMPPPPPHMDHEISQELRKGFLESQERSLRNIPAFIALSTAAGLALGVYWQHRVQKDKTETLKRDVKDLERAEQSWQERMVAVAPSASASGRDV